MSLTLTCVLWQFNFDHRNTTEFASGPETNKKREQLNINSDKLVIQTQVIVSRIIQIPEAHL